MGNQARSLRKRTKLPKHRLDADAGDDTVVQDILDTAPPIAVNGQQTATLAPVEANAIAVPRTDTVDTCIVEEPQRSDAVVVVFRDRNGSEKSVRREMRHTAIPLDITPSVEDKPRGDE